VMLDAGYDEDPLNTTYFWTRPNIANRYYTVSTNGNWIDFQTHPVKVTNGETGCMNTDSITVMFDYNECEISVPENSENPLNQIIIHPNPNIGNFSVSVNNNIGNLKINILNSQGKTVFTENWNINNTASYSKQINANLKSGIYYIMFNTGNEQLTKKIIVNNKR